LRMKKRPGPPAYDGCSVLGYPCRIDFFRAEALLIASSVNATMICFFLYGLGLDWAVMPQLRSSSSKYRSRLIPTVRRFVRICVTGTSRGLVLITTGRLIPTYQVIPLLALDREVI
jgi:hypothetical protein